MIMGTVFLAIILIFIVGYAGIALEHPLKINKTATALLLGVVLWTLLATCGESACLPDFFAKYNEGEGFLSNLVHHELLLHLGDISEIIFFLLGAMTIVELIDTYGGFKIITDKIHTVSRVKFLWVIGFLAFFLSAVLDNMTTTIVMVTLLRKMVSDKHDRWFFAGMVVLAANAGGAWSPIGDVTTIMLWIAGKVSAVNIMLKTFLASLFSIMVPLIILSFTMRGNFQKPSVANRDVEMSSIPSVVSRLVLFVGVGLLLFVPVFKTITHLPPYIGMLGALSVLWMLTEILQVKHKEKITDKFKVSSIISKVDVPSVLFFLGILLAVAALQTAGHLTLLSRSLDTIALPDQHKYFLISGIIGVLSSVVDNVPLVAGAMGMYGFPMDHYFWEFLAYCAGTGGSILIIGSAAGVAAMGLEKIDFIWYLKHISWLALIGYIAGAAIFIAQYLIFHL
ncbi:MAG: sodium:proton antiporter NhaD [Bacteroidales bacterium]|jgi:Na+/H+ antiporter NhaD/arsenite permease-like protein|nr:sodium:proton antiporter NhaD [Bacteroidales bacterium]